MLEKELQNLQAGDVIRFGPCGPWREVHSLSFLLPAVVVIFHDGDAFTGAAWRKVEVSEPQPEPTAVR